MDSEAQRLLLQRIVESAVRGLEGLMAPLSGEDPSEVREALMFGLPILGEMYGDMAASVAYDSYSLSRDERGVPGFFEPVTPDPPDMGRWRSLSMWGSSSLLPGVGSSDPLEAKRNSLTRVSGGLQRTVLDQHRRTITQSAVADPQAKGWRRVGSGRSTCSICLPLVNQGVVYSEASASFDTHDFCNCSAEVDWSAK